MFHGLAGNQGLVIVPLYIAELSDTKSRAIRVILFNLSLSIGVTLGYCVNATFCEGSPKECNDSNPDYWRVQLSLTALPLLALLPLMREKHLPESTVWAIQGASWGRHRCPHNLSPLSSLSMVFPTCD